MSLEIGMTMVADFFKCLLYIKGIECYKLSLTLNSNLYKCTKTIWINDIHGVNMHFLKAKKSTVSINEYASKYRLA